MSGINITVVNLNPCIDWQCAVSEYTHGGLNRVRRTREDVAGKGINVAVALKNLGFDPLCTGFLFAENGTLLTSRLNALGVRHDFIETDGAIRVNIKLYEESSGIMTEFNQPGAFVVEHAQKMLLKKIKSLCEQDTGILVLSGSRPQGVASDFYAKICNIWKGKVFLDTEGEALMVALNTAPPYAIKPNRFELESTFGVKLPAPKDIADFCRSNIISHVVKIICVSLGADGAVIVTRAQARYCPALNVQPKGVAGAGDAMVAGMVYALASGLPEEEFLPNAMAAAAASVILEGTQMCTFQSFTEMLKKMPLPIPLYC